MIPNEKRDLNLPRNSTKNLPDVVRFVQLIKSIRIFLECDSESKMYGGKEIFIPCAECRREVKPKLNEMLELIEKFSQVGDRRYKKQDSQTDIIEE